MLAHHSLVIVAEVTFEMLDVRLTLSELVGVLLLGIALIILARVGCLLS